MIQGGLGVLKDLQLFSEALLDKWLWRFIDKKENLWRKVVTIRCVELG